VRGHTALFIYLAIRRRSPRRSHSPIPIARAGSHRVTYGGTRRYRALFVVAPAVIPICVPTEPGAARCFASARKDGRRGAGPRDGREVPRRVYAAEKRSGPLKSTAVGGAAVEGVSAWKISPDVAPPEPTSGHGTRA